MTINSRYQIVSPVIKRGHIAKSIRESINYTIIEDPLIRNGGSRAIFVQVVRQGTSPKIEVQVVGNKTTREISEA